ncbi:MAG: YdeI/OmpD-associated family protein [Gemmatimonadota bacterium]|nr:YdeI/OmpD-associated family protein [Gemmatimonadota bacterium]
MPPSPAPRSFKTAATFRTWLAKHHASKTELWLRLFKKHAAARGMTYPQALEEALCYGWIDGVVAALDDVSYAQRFTPRKPRSIWSNVNVAKVEALIVAGRMTPPGMAAYAARDPARTGIYSFEKEAAALTPAYQKQFRAAKAAWAWFESQPPGYKRLMTYRVMRAKREETRLRRLEQLIAASAKRIRL